MKNIKNFVVVIVLFILFFGSFVVEYVSSQDVVKLE